MKRNVFQKQDDSEVPVTAQAKAEPETDASDSNESPAEQAHFIPAGDVVNLVNINQIYTDHTPPNVVFKDFNLDIKDIKTQGQFITIMGKSGCGKSTLLRYISGLQEPTSGDIYIYGKKRTDKDRIPMVFQQYTSFEWKTVLQNVALPLILKGVPKNEANEKAMDMIEIVGLAGHEKKWAKYPILSGGQLQRVAIARNLVVNPQILLMDEPFGALDTVTRKQIQVFLRSIFENAKIDPTVIFVTHSESEAVFLSTDIYILDSGPATIRHQMKIDLPQKRDDSVRYSAVFTDYVNKLGSLLEDLKKEGR
ncbi:MAG: Taurine-transporting ATPase [Bacteroidetes bacterium]|nr:Taurine-transporting ATPase [Bacteroidota bacterium]MBS1233553.1 Taurine-transporting ATPase [Bacteroidota bacterium]